MGRFNAFTQSHGGAASLILQASATPLLGLLNANVTHIATDTTAGFKLAEIECGWDQGEPTQGTFSASYIASKVAIIKQYKDAGYKVAVSAGIHYAPAWAMALPNGQYIDQFATSSGTPNFVWNQAVRDAAAAYINQLTQAISAVVLVDYVRVGLSPSGECYLPGTSTNQWWAFDALAQGSGSNLPAGISICPLPGWIPGTATYNSSPITVNQATSWWNWYMGAIVNGHAWEMAAWRSAGWGGLIQLCMPGTGAVPTVITNRLNNQLSLMAGNTNDQTMNIGAAWHLLLAGLVPFTNTVVDISSLYDNSGSPINNSATVSDTTLSLAQADPYVSHWSSARWIAYLAAKQGLTCVGENVGSNLAADVAGIMTQAKSCGVYGIMWANDDQLYDGTHATAAQVSGGFSSVY